MKKTPSVIVNLSEHCKASGRPHALRVARARGQKVRHQCTSCLRYTKWVKPANATEAQRGKAAEKQIKDEQRDLNEGTVFDPTWLNGATVADLREQCKEQGITGYSKMKRADLIDVLTKKG